MYILWPYCVSVFGPFSKTADSSSSESFSYLGTKNEFVSSIFLYLHTFPSSLLWIYPIIYMKYELNYKLGQIAKDSSN